MRYGERLTLRAARLLSLPIVLLMCGIGDSSRAVAQAVAPEIPTGQALVDLITRLEARVNAAYTNCDLDTLLSMHTPDVELYRDEAGRVVGRDAVRKVAEGGVCALRKQGTQRRTEVTPGTFMVYPLPRFGALAFSTVVVWQRRAGEPETKLGTLKQVTVWEQRDGRWMVARHIAYAHQGMAST